jgi:hypothetical protein
VEQSGPAALCAISLEVQPEDQKDQPGKPAPNVPRSPTEPAQFADFSSQKDVLRYERARPAWPPLVMKMNFRENILAERSQQIIENTGLQYSFPEEPNFSAPPTQKQLKSPRKRR